MSQQQAELQDQLAAYVRDLRVRVEVIRPWELQMSHLIGAGAFGEVHLARWRGCEVACKRLSPSALLPGGAATSTEAVADLMREADMLATLRHPNVVSVYGVVLPDTPKTYGGGGGGGEQPCLSMLRAASSGSALQSPALVTEYLAGGSLRAAMSREADWLAAPAARVKLMLDTARGLEYLHSKHIVHFDLKSANVLIGLARGRAPSAKLCDFGLSKQRHNTYVSGVTSLRGTLPWMAPEILTSPDTVTEKSDIYSFGVVMWEVWTYQEPFAGMPLHALLHQLTQPSGLRLPLPGDPDWEAACRGEDCTAGGGGSFLGAFGRASGGRGGRRSDPSTGGGGGGATEGAPGGEGGGAGSCSRSSGGGQPEPAPGWERLLRACWARDAGARPSARELVAALEGMLRLLRPAGRASNPGYEGRPPLAAPAAAAGASSAFAAAAGAAGPDSL